jgi:hypothetical protein
MVPVWSTPKNPENHARFIRREIDNCPHSADPAVNSNSGDDNGSKDM